MTSGSSYRTEIGRAVAGVLAGAVTAALLIAPLMTLNVLSWDEDQPSWPWQGLFDVALTTGFCMLFLVSSFIFGAPFWAWLNSIERRRWWEAAAIGFVTSFVPFLAFMASGGEMRWRFLLAPAGFGTIGALCWLAGWFVAYRNV